MKIDSLNNADEGFLVKCCQSNEPAAQKVLYSRYAEMMMLVCLRYISSQEDAKEVLMDGFLNFFKHIGSFNYRGDGSVKAWLKTIVINQCLMHLRKKQPFYIQAKEIEDYDTDNGEDMLSNLSVKEILLLVHALPDGYRAVFNLYVFEGRNHREIGELLGINENTSKSQLHRAKAMLKEKLLKEAKINY